MDVPACLNAGMVTEESGEARLVPFVPYTRADTYPGLLMTLTLISLGRAALLAATSLALACGALPQFSADEVDCRATVTAEGEPASEPVRWFRVDDDKDFAFQKAWCAGVGPAVVWTAPLPEGEAHTRLRWPPWY